MDGSSLEEMELDLVRISSIISESGDFLTVNCRSEEHRTSLRMRLKSTVFELAQEFVADAESHELRMSVQSLIVTLGGFELSKDDTLEQCGLEDGANVTLSNTGGISLIYESDFDTHGVVYYLGTDCGKNEKWKNPHPEFVTCSYSSHFTTSGTIKSDFIARRENVYNRTECENANEWMAVRLHTARLCPSHYTLRYARDDDGQGYLMRNWRFEGKDDHETEWTTIRQHVEDKGIPDDNSMYKTFTWELKSDRSFRSFRVINDQQLSYVHAAIELYGELCHDEAAPGATGVPGEEPDPPCGPHKEFSKARTPNPRLKVHHTA